MTTYNEAMAEARSCDQRATDNKWPADRGHWTGKAMEWREKARAARAHQERASFVRARLSAGLVAALLLGGLLLTSPAQAATGGWLSDPFGAVQGWVSTVGDWYANNRAVDDWKINASARYIFFRLNGKAAITSTSSWNRYSRFRDPNGDGLVDNKEQHDYEQGEGSFQ